MYQFTAISAYPVMIIVKDGSGESVNYVIFLNITTSSGIDSDGNPIDLDFSQYENTTANNNYNDY